MKKEIVKRYSQALKQQVVREYESGASVNKLQKKYGIRGSVTIQRWIKKYSHAGLRSEVMVIQSPEDQIEFKAMKSRIVDLESALAESVLENRMLKATLEVASDALGMDLTKTSARHHKASSIQRAGEQATVQSLVWDQPSGVLSGPKARTAKSRRRPTTGDIGARYSTSPPPNGRAKTTPRTARADGRFGHFQG